MTAKKWAALLLTAALALSLSSCGGTDKGGGPVGSGSYDAAGNYRPSVPDLSRELAAAMKENPDVVGWLQVPGTKIDEPVVQTTNNEYYLRRDYRGKYSYEGCYYLDYESVMFEGGDDLAQNSIIYGHNLGTPLGVKDDPDGPKFAQLFKLEDEETAKRTPYVYFHTESGPKIFEIFAVFYSEAVLSPVPYHYADYSPEDLERLVKDVKARSIFTYDVDVKPEDRLLTLSTCSYKYGTYTQNPDQRYVVMARLVQKGEPYHETADLKRNPNPKEPNFG